MKQREIPLLAEARQTKTVAKEFVQGCRNMTDSVLLCVQLGHLPQGVVADELGIDKGNWSRMMQGSAHFPINRLTALMELCGNYAPLQFLADSNNFDLAQKSNAAYIAELEAELNRARKAG